MEWRDIEGYEGIYEVSCTGLVRRAGRVLKNNVCTNNYLSVSLSREGKVTPHRVHRLVAKAFLSNPENKPHVNHKDSNRQNNNVDNLEWVTVSENMKHSYDKGGRLAPKSWKGRVGSDHNKSKGFTLISPKGDKLVFGSGLEAKRLYGFDNTSISYALVNQSIPYTFKRGKLRGYTILVKGDAL